MDVGDYCKWEGQQGDERITGHIHTIFQPKNLEILDLTEAPITQEHNASLESLVIEMMETDTFSHSILQALDHKHSKHPQVSHAECNIDGKLLLVNGLIYLADYDPLRVEMVHT